MSDIRSENDDEVIEKVREATSAACGVLDSLFPGADDKANPGVTSNFAGLLEAAIMEMLKGRSILDDVRGHSTHLPQLVVDQSFFGYPQGSHDAYLIVMYGRDPERKELNGEGLLALCPDSDRLAALDLVSDAFTSVEAAAIHAANWLKEEGISIERAREMKLLCKPVGFTESTSGYFVLDPSARRRAA